MNYRKTADKAPEESRSLCEIFRENFDYAALIVSVLALMLYQRYTNEKIESSKEESRIESENYNNIPGWSHNTRPTTTTTYRTGPRE